jgi:hypothetical protein
VKGDEVIAKDETGPLHDFPDRAIREALRNPENFRELVELLRWSRML